jgi:exodeoxyribonuclease V alpha subunit
MDMIQANLTHIKFERDGFLIGVFQDEKNEFAALGNILRPEIGMEYRLFGKWSVDPRFGKQYKFKTFETIIPKSTDGIYRYVVRVARWVGPKTGKALIETYGVDTLDVLREKPNDVATDIKGITLVRAQEIQATIKKNQQFESAMVELEKLIGGFGLRASLPVDLLQKWGADAVPLLKENPYRLIEMKQVGFPSADRLAIDRFKVKPQSVFRQQAAVIHTIREKTQGEGHVWVNEEELLQDVKWMIQCDPSEGLARALGKGAIVQEDGCLALMAMARDEDCIAEKVKELLRWTLEKR